MPVAFGTDGWRDIIAQDFTEANVARVAAAHARFLMAQGEGAAGERSVVIGFDTRFGGERFARVAAREFARRDLKVLIARQALPTPALSFAVRHFGAAGGVMITASHNPPEYSGYKLKGSYGGSATPGMVREVEAQLKTADSFVGKAAGTFGFDVREAYYASLDNILDLDTLRAYRGVMYHDAMGGSGGGWITGYARHAGLSVDVRPVRGAPDPLFYGVNPEPVPQNLTVLSQVLAGETDPTFGTVTDGDADRVGAVVAGGHFFNSHQIFAVLIKHLFERGWRGRVVKTVSGSAIIDRLCARLGLELVETPVGFKYITDAFLEGLQDDAKAVLIGGEESGGLAARGHIPERDGILNSLLLLEAVARSGKSLPRLFAEIEALTDFRHFYDRNDLHLAPDFDKFGALSRAEGWHSVAGKRVVDVVTKDGVKLVLEGGAWAMLRASGTEPVVRVYVEAQHQDDLRAILDEATTRVQS